MPAAVVAAVEIAFLAEAFYLLLYGRAVDRQIVRHLGESDEGLVAQERKQATAVPAPEVDPLTVVPPSVFVGTPHDVYLALHLLAHRLAEEGVGVQFICDAFREDRLLKIGKAFEESRE